MVLTNENESKLKNFEKEMQKLQYSSHSLKEILKVHNLLVWGDEVDRNNL